MHTALCHFFFVCQVFFSFEFAFAHVLYIYIYTFTLLFIITLKKYTQLGTARQPRMMEIYHQPVTWQLLGVGMLTWSRKPAEIQIENPNGEER